jgi:hypothetical protein
MSAIQKRLTACLTLLGTAALVGCGHESVASTGTPPSPAAVAVVSAPHTESPAPAPESQQVAAAEPVRQDASEPAPKPAPKDPASTRAPADRAPTRPGDAQKITFDDLNLGMAQDMVFRPFLMTDRVKELDGTKVRITGFIHAGAASTKGIHEFVLLKNTECKFGAGGQADHLAMVYLTKGETTKYQLEAVKVEGTLKVKPFDGPDGNTWSVYDLTDAKVVQ